MLKPSRGLVFPISQATHFLVAEIVEGGKAQRKELSKKIKLAKRYRLLDF